MTDGSVLLSSRAYHVPSRDIRALGSDVVKVNQNLLSWVGYQPENEELAVETSGTAPVDASAAERIKALEARIAELESAAPRVDLTAMTADEVELVASEAAVTVIKAAQAREAAARAEVQRVMDSTKRDLAAFTASLKAEAEADARMVRDTAKAEQERVNTWLGSVYSETQMLLERNRKMIATCLESMQQVDALLASSQEELRGLRKSASEATE